MITSRTKARRDSQDSCDSLLWDGYASAATPQRSLLAGRSGTQVRMDKD